MARKKIILDCECCKKSYEKDLSEFVRNSKLGRKSYCSINCAAKDINSLSKVDIRNVYDISQHSGNRMDEFSKFRYYIKLINLRNRKFASLSLEDLKQIWNKQKGICPYTNLKLILMDHTFSHKNHPFYRIASLDRIDSSKGYTIDNVEFVSLAINFLKNKYTKQEVIEFLSIIKKTDCNGTL